MTTATLHVVLWIVLAMGVMVLAVGCVEWFKGRGRNLALAGIANVLLVAGILLGSNHPVWRDASFVAVIAFAAYTFVALRGRIRWNSPLMLFGGATILLVLVIEIVMERVPDVPAVVVEVLLWALGVSGVLFIVSMFWEFGRAYRRYRASRR